MLQGTRYYFHSVFSRIVVNPLKHIYRIIVIVGGIHVELYYPTETLQLLQSFRVGLSSTVPVPKLKSKPNLKTSRQTGRTKSVGRLSYTSYGVRTVLRSGWPRVGSAIISLSGVRGTSSLLLIRNGKLSIPSVELTSCSCLRLEKSTVPP
jgi:hypothetical protein